MNLILAIIDTVIPNFSGVETQGWFVVSVIILNSGSNALFSLGGFLLEIYHKLKKEVKYHDRESRVQNPANETTIQHINPVNHSPGEASKAPLPNESVSQNRTNSNVIQRAFRPAVPLERIKRVVKILSLR